jgi:integrase/recombinase XerD
MPGADRCGGGEEGRELSRTSEEYLSWLAVERGRSANTLAAYRRDLLRYEEFLDSEGKDPLSVLGSDIDAHLEWLRSVGLSPASVGRALAGIRGLHRFILEEGLAERDPSAEVLAPGRPVHLPKALSEEEVLRLLATASGGSPLDRRDLAMMELLYGTGMRVSELTALSLGDQRYDAGLLRVMGKGSKERLVPLSGYAAEALERWLGPYGRPLLLPSRPQARQDAEALFLNARARRITRQGVWYALESRARAAGLADRFHPHLLRHSCATHMLAHGADIRVVQELLGHVSVATTQIYTSVSGEHLRQAYLQAHPRA